MLRKTLFAGVLMCAALSVYALDVVKDGVAVSEIVVAKDAHHGVKLAAQDLQKYIKEMSGAELPIVNEPTLKVKNKLYVGESEFTNKLGYKLPEFQKNESGYDILVKGNYAVFSGTMTVENRPPYKYPMTLAERNYLERPTKNIERKRPENMPSAELKKWWDFFGEHFLIGNFGNVLGDFNKELGIYCYEDIGPWYSVSAFLENLGVRFYAPDYDVSGTVVPDKKNIWVQDGRETKQSAYARRSWCYYGGMRSDAEGISWLKRMKCGVASPIIFNHSLIDIYSNYDQLQRHPEWFCFDAPGQVTYGAWGQGMPRLTDPGFRKACLLWVDKVMEYYPNLTGISLGTPDGGVKMDYRDIPVYTENGKIDLSQAASNYVWDFHVAIAKEIRKKHPDLKLFYWAGGGAMNFPTNMKADDPDNIYKPSLGNHPSDRVVSLVQKQYDLEFEQWRKALKSTKKGGKVPEWNYFLYYRDETFPHYPVFFMKSLQTQMQDWRHITDGKFMELNAAFGPDARQIARLKEDANSVNISQEERRLLLRKADKLFARIGAAPAVQLMMYVQNKLFWDPDLDLQLLLDEYYKLWFGPAEREMKAFHEFAEAVWCRQESRSVTETSGFLKEKDIQKYFELLSAAKAKTKEGSVYYKRIDNLEKFYEPIKTIFAGLKRSGPNYNFHLQNSSEVDGNLSKYKNGWIVMRENFTGEYLTQNRTDVVANLTSDRKFMMIGVRCWESNMKGIKASCNAPDDVGIFNDDVVEVYLDSAEHSYFKIAINSNGAIYDESTDVSTVSRDTLAILWNPGIKALVKKYDDRWEMEVMIPLADLGMRGATKEYPYGLQVARTRFASTDGKVNCQSIAPTGGMYALPAKWGRAW